jgi:cysteine-rich repeat protein
MAPLVRSAVALLSLSLVGSCSPEIKDAPTQIMVRVDSSNSQLKASFSELRVSLARREGDHWEQGSQQTLSSKIIKGRWPIDLPVVPRSPGDDFKQFQVVLDLMKGGKLLAQNRAVTTFLPNERKMLELWIEACPGHDAGFVCAESDCEGAACEVCNPADGTCIPVGVTDPKKLSALTDDALATDRDAGPVGRTKDTGTTRDARSAKPGEDPDFPSDESDAGDSRGKACDADGAMRCTRAGAPQRQVCESGTWADAEPCAEDEICDGTDPDAPKCVELSSACKGSAGKAACSGSILQVCSKDGVASGQKDCKSERQCQLGLARGECAACVPGVARCTGAKLEVCSEDGLGFALKETCESASLCNATAVACTKSACLPGTKTCAGDVLQACNADQTAFELEKKCEAGLCDNMGKQCDVCLAGASKCEGDVVETCNTDGQSYKMMACSGQTSHCVGAGKCVQCAATADCPVPAKDCQVAACNTALGTCSNAPKAARAACAGGLCDGNGDCVACIANSDCKSGDVCKIGACSTPAKRGDGVVNQTNEECDDGNQVNTDSCTDTCTKAACGDSYLQDREACDPKDSRWSAWDCDMVSCRVKTMYNPCLEDSDCLGLELCLTRFCSPRCKVVGVGPSDCPEAPPGLTPLCAFAAVGEQGYCVASGCTKSSDCSPKGQACLTANPVNYCTGCKINADCPRGKTCVFNKPGEQPGIVGFCQ